MFVECSIDEFGGREVRERALELEFQHPSYKHFLLRYNGKPAGIACIFQYGHNARVESVGTLREYRGRGFVKSLLLRIQEEAQDAGYNSLWVFPMNQGVERIY